VQSKIVQNATKMAIALFVNQECSELMMKMEFNVSQIVLKITLLIGTIENAFNVTLYAQNVHLKTKTCVLMIQLLFVEAPLYLFLVTTLSIALINAHEGTSLQDLINACNASQTAKIAHL
jgi:ABC-type transport system involved in cytochrome c biogenesis permease component